METSKVSALVRFVGVSPSGVADSFDDRLRIQKAVFLLKHLGVKPFDRYDFNMYLRGPYSPGLANEYYNLTGKPAGEIGFDEKTGELLLWFISHETAWLEVAASVISIKENYPRMKDPEVLSLLRMSKPWVEAKFFGSLSSELRDRGVLE